MSDRKWLNLVIFLISVMMILFLILQKNLETQTESLPPQNYLIETTFEPVMLRINGRWLPIEQIKQELKPEQWKNFEEAWKVQIPMAISHQNNETIENGTDYTLVWDNGNSRRSFKLSDTEATLYIQSMRDPKNIYRFNQQQASLLLPTWLIDKTRIE